MIRGSVTGKHGGEVIVEGRRDITQFVEQHHGILLAEANAFVQEALETFRFTARPMSTPAFTSVCTMLTV
ncbi:hypothetical protein [Pseudomonas oryzihabitans]|uniref:hypothetical protein n=1 Tax=Pseudomonas oryzihabitans TaxID=47885 RepID=UPI003C6DE33E